MELVNYTVAANEQRCQKRRIKYTTQIYLGPRASVKSRANMPKNHALIHDILNRKSRENIGAITEFNSNQFSGILLQKQQLFIISGSKLWRSEVTKFEIIFRQLLVPL